MKKFGTDGIRNTLGKEPLTWSSLQDLAIAIAKKTLTEANPKVCIARDTRHSGEKIAGLFINTLLSMGIDVFDCGIIPTGVLAWLTQNLNCEFGVMITASHNLSCDNGVKILDKKGGKLSEQQEEQIIKIWHNPGDIIWTNSNGRLLKKHNEYQKYKNWLSSIFPKTTRNITIVLDLANGAACSFLVEFLEELGCTVIPINNSPDGNNININSACFDHNLLQKLVIKNNANLGIALDGDADRLIVCDDQGSIWDGDDLLYLLITIELMHNRIPKGVALTEVSNQGLVESLTQLGVKTYRTDIGDKYVARCLQENSWQFGGEPCGHLIDNHFSKVSEPTIIILRLIHLSMTNSISEMPKPKKYPTMSMSFPKQNIDIQNLKEQAHTQYPKIRWLIRASGTEDVIRVHGEHPDLDILNTAFDWIKEFMKK